TVCVDLGVVVGDLSSRLKVYPDDAYAVERLTLDVLDVIDRGRQDAFVNKYNPRFDLVRGHAEELPHHADDGDVDRREDVRGHAVDGDHAEHSDQQGDHHERVGAAQR